MGTLGSIRIGFVGWRRWAPWSAGLGIICAIALTGCDFTLAIERGGGDATVAGDGVVVPDLGPRPDGDVTPPADGLVPKLDSGGVDPCASSTCVTPPAPACIDAKTLRSHNLVGVCVAGACSYAEKVTTCSGSCVAGACLTAATVLYVDSRNGGAEQGTAKAPYRTISAAVTQAGSNTAIFVATGNYVEKVTVKNKVIELVGGYLGGTAAAYGNGTGGDFASRDPAANVTTITAASGGPTLTLQQAGSTLVAGFTITGPGRGVYCDSGGPTLASNRVKGNNTPNSQGGGVYATDCNLTLRDNVIENNIGSRGGGVATQGGKLLFQGNLLRNNEGREDHGGGMYLSSSDVELRDNRFEGNKVGLTLGYGWGGGVALIDCTARLRGNVATGNRATTFGGAVFVDDGSVATLENELYHANLCGDGGAGLYVDGLDASVKSTATLNNVTIVNHKCPGQGNGLLVEQSNVTVRNSIFWDNGADGVVAVNGSSLTVSYTNAGKLLPGVGNKSVNPKFVGSGAAIYRLASKVGRWDGATWVTDAESSPCLDQGDPALGAGDEPAPNGGKPNLGAFGRTPTASKSP